MVQGMKSIYFYSLKGLISAKQNLGLMNTCIS